MPIHVTDLFPVSCLFLISLYTHAGKIGSFQYNNKKRIINSILVTSCISQKMLNKLKMINHQINVSICMNQEKKNESKVKIKPALGQWQILFHKINRILPVMLHKLSICQQHGCLCLSDSPGSFCHSPTRGDFSRAIEGGAFMHLFCESLFMHHSSSSKLNQQTVCCMKLLLSTTGCSREHLSELS